MLMNYRTLTRLFFVASALACPAWICAQEAAAVEASPEAAVEKAKPTAPKTTALFVPACDISEAISVPAPIFADVKNLKDKTFDTEAALRTVIPSPEQLKFVSATAADGLFKPADATIPADGEAAQLRVYRFFVTTQAYAKLNVKVTTPQFCEVYVDGVKRSDKLNAQESWEKAGSVSVDIASEMRRYEVQVKTLSSPGDKAAPAVKLEVTSEKAPEKAGVTFLKADDKRPLTIADVNEGENIVGGLLSPDGKYILNTFSELLPDASSRSRMEVREVATGKVVFFSDGNNYAWMPKGARLYRNKVTGGKRAYIAYDLATKQETVLVEGLPHADHAYTWLPDESGFIVTRTERWTDPTDNYKRVLNIADRTGSFRNRSYLSVYKFADGVMRPLTAGSKTTALTSVSNDSKSILFVVSELDYSLPEYYKHALYKLDLDTMETEKLIEDEKYDFSARFSPDGKQVLLVGGTNCFGGIGRNLPEGVIGNSYDKQAFIMDLATKKIDPISRDFDPSIAAVVWAGDGNIYFTTEDKDYKTVYRYSPTTREYTRMNVPAEAVYGFSVSTNPENFVPIAAALGQKSLVPVKAFIVDLNKNESREYLAARQEMVDAVAMPSEQAWNFKSSAGTEITGQYFLPPNFDPNKRYPMIVYYYGGTTPTTRSFGSSYSFPLWAAKGYVVYVVQPSGATGFGQAFSAAHVNAWGKRTADDIIEGVKQFCAEHAFVDPKKVGCIGASYGGFMTMYLQTRTDIFSAAVAHAGISDITSYWGEGFWGTGYNAIAAAGSFPWKNKEIFVEQSPLFSADKVNTPILLCHGQVDTNVPVGESIQMFAALKILGKPVELLTFKGEDHFILDYNRRKQWTKSQLAWFDRWLKGDSDWWYALYPESKKNW